jgi:futalosine hydrolase
MEGAVLVQVARTFGVPVGELRGISNPVGNRDRSAWRLDEAARQAQEALLRWLNG